jgi:hypothetical protein
VASISPRNKLISWYGIAHVEVNDVNDRATGDDTRSTDGSDLPESDASRTDIEAYETADGVVLYDAQNPLAWMKASNAVALGDRL